MAEKQLRPLSVSEPCFSLGKINLYFLKLFRKENAAGHVFPRVFHGSPSSALYKAEGLRARGRECHRQWCPDELHLPRLREVRAQQIQEWETFLGFPYLPAEMDWTWTCTSVYLGGWHSVGLPNLLHIHCAASQHLPGQLKVFWKRYQRGRRIKSFWDFPDGQLPGWLTPRSRNASTGQTTCIGCLLLHFGPGVYAKLYMHRDSCWSYRNTKQITKLF